MPTLEKIKPEPRPRRPEEMAPVKTRHPLPVVPDAPVDLAPDLRERDVDPERRAFLRTAAAGAALASLAGCGGVTMEEFSAPTSRSSP